VAIPLITLEGASTLSKTLCGLASSLRGMTQHSLSGGGQTTTLLEGITDAVELSPNFGDGLAGQAAAVMG
jgi:hypothetical protein